MAREPLHILRLLDTAPAVPTGVPYTRVNTRVAAGLAVGPPSTLPEFADAQLYLMHTKPEMFDDWQRDMADDLRCMMLDRIPGHVEFSDWDCHNCEHTVVAMCDDRGNARCPVCFARQP